MPPTFRRLCDALLCSLLVLQGALFAADSGSLHRTAARRRPVAAVLTGDGRSLCVANQNSGTLSLIDLETRQVVSEQKIGEQLSDLVRLECGGDVSKPGFRNSSSGAGDGNPSRNRVLKRPDGPDLLLVTDRAAHELLVVEQRGETFDVRQRIAVARHPVSVAVSADGATVAVAGLWSRRVTLLSRSEIVLDVDHETASEISDLASQISDRSQFFVTGTIRLPFSPRRMLLLDRGRRLVVLDAFGGELALIDVKTAGLVSTRSLPAQNIRGSALSADGERVLLAHQVLSPLARADFDDIHWGNLLRNVLREVPIEALLDPQADVVGESRTVPLGDVGHGAADPAGVVVIPSRHAWLTCLSGTGEAKIQTSQSGGRVEVGAQPVAAVGDSQRGLAYVVCRLDDAIAVVDPVRLQVHDRIALGPRVDSTPADRGEGLFIDGRRSHDGWISCQSCHPDGHTTGGLADTFSDGSFGTPKRILSLLGTRDSNPWAWNGQFRELHEQVASSFESSLQGERLPAAKVADVVAYLHLLTSPPPVDDGEWTDEQQSQIATGRQIFNQHRCGRCHVPPQTFTIDLMYDVGLADEEGLQKFNPPSLRGVGHRQRLFHDGRAASLSAVFTEYTHQIDEPLAEDELAALVMYLGSL